MGVIVTDLQKRGYLVQICKKEVNEYKEAKFAQIPYY